MTNENKQFVFIFSLGGNKLEWSGDQISALLERATGPDERERLRKWMENCKVGGFLILSGGATMCVGADPAMNGSPPHYFTDEGHGITEKSKAAFLRHRKDIGPVDRVEARLGSDGLTHEVTVIGKNGSQIGLTGFGVGRDSGGTGFVGFKWLLDMCGVRYDAEEVARVNLEEVSVAYESMRQTASGLIIESMGSPESPVLEAEVRVDQSNGKMLRLMWPLEGEVDFFTDADEMVDLVLQDMKIRGIEWTADPRISIRYRPDRNFEGKRAYIESLRVDQAKRIGWNYYVEAES